MKVHRGATAPSRECVRSPVRYLRGVFSKNGGHHAILRVRIWSLSLAHETSTHPRGSKFCPFLVIEGIPEPEWISVTAFRVELSVYKYISPAVNSSIHTCTNRPSLNRPSLSPQRRCQREYGSYTFKYDQPSIRYTTLTHIYAYI